MVRSSGCCINDIGDYAHRFVALNPEVSKGGNKVLPDNWLQESTGSDSFEMRLFWWLMQPEVFAAEGVFGRFG